MFCRGAAAYYIVRHQIMTPRHVRAIERYFEANIGPDWNQSGPRNVSPAEALEALWTLNSMFQPNYHLIQSLPFAAGYERDADRALEKLSLGGKWNEREPRPIVWRVLLERHIQSMVVVQANGLHGSPRVSVIPSALQQAHLPLAMALFLQYEMKFVLPVGQHLPEQLQVGGPPTSLARH